MIENQRGCEREGESERARNHRAWQRHDRERRAGSLPPIPSLPASRASLHPAPGRGMRMRRLSVSRPTERRFSGKKIINGPEYTITCGLINLNSFAPMPQWQHTARETTLAQVHEAPDPQFNWSHTHSTSQLLLHTRELSTLMSSCRLSPGEPRPAFTAPLPSSTPHNHLTPTRTPKHGVIPTH